jgi:tetratricopeptide (TPR) repeat protein
MMNKRILCISLSAPFALVSFAADTPAAYAEGVAACESGNFDQCAKRVAAAVALAPRSSQEKNYIPFFYLGLAAYNQGEAAKAAACFEREAGFGVVGRTSQAQTFASLRKILADRPATTTDKTGLGLCAPPVTKSAPATAPATPPVAQPIRPPVVMTKNLEWFERYDIGRKACDTGRWEECAKEMETAAAKQPASASGLTGFGPAPLDYTPWYYLGLAAFNHGEPEKAEALLKKEAGFGVIDKSGNAAAFLTLRKALTAARPPPELPPGLLAAAPGPLQPGSAPAIPRPAPPANVSNSDEKSAQADYVRGVNLVAGDKYQEAADAFENALKKDPRPHQWIRDYGMWFQPYIPHYYLAICYFQLGKLDDARHHIRISQAQELHGRLADQGGKLLDLSESIDQKEKPNDPATLYTLTEGLNRMLTGDYDRAARVFEFLINAAPRWAEAHLYLGVSYYALSARYQESGNPGDAGRAEEMRVLARKEFKFAHKYDKRLTLSKIMLSPGLTDFWNKTLE